MFTVNLVQKEGCQNPKSSHQQGLGLVGIGGNHPDPQATFEDALEEEAINKRHSLTCEAVEVGSKAKAFRTVLTHFSQRYPKIPVIDASFQTTTCIAFDLMTVNLVGAFFVLLSQLSQ